MRLTALIMAQGSLRDVAGGYSRLSASERERLIVLGAVLLASVLAGILVVLLRRRHHHHHHHHHSHRSHDGAGEVAGSIPAKAPAEPKGRKWRRRRREHRPRNPTLAETGGLPPVRRSEPPPPPD